MPVSGEVVQTGIDVALQVIGQLPHGVLEARLRKPELLSKVLRRR